MAKARQSDLMKALAAMARRGKGSRPPVQGPFEEWHATAGADHAGPIGPDPDMPRGATWGDGPSPSGPRMGRRQAKARNRANLEEGLYEGVARQTPSAVDRLRGRHGTLGLAGMAGGAVGGTALLAQLLAGAGGQMPETGGIGLPDPGVGSSDLDDMSTMIEMMRGQRGRPVFSAGDPEMRAFIEAEWDRVAQSSMPVGRSLRERMAERGYL